MTDKQISALKRKIAAYCAYRERCRKEIQDKLSDLGATVEMCKDIITWLEQENYFNNQRFAISFARGKFSNNNWGKHRIMLELKVREIAPEDINFAMKEIETDEYHRGIEKLAMKKWNEIKLDDIYLKKQKTASFLTQKGFEPELAWKVTEKLEHSMFDTDVS
jgi:regulatory protein